MRLFAMMMGVALAAGCAAEPAEELVLSRSTESTLTGTYVAADGAHWEVNGAVDASGPSLTITRQSEPVLETVTVDADRIDVLVDGESLARAMSGDDAAREAVRAALDGEIGADLQAILIGIEERTAADSVTRDWGVYAGALTDWLSSVPADEVGYDHGGKHCYFCVKVMGYLACLACEDVENPE